MAILTNSSKILRAGSSVIKVNEASGNNNPGGTPPPVTTSTDRGYAQTNSLFGLELASTRLFKAFRSLVNAQSYAWDFGDGNTSTEQHPVHQYPDTVAKTIYTVTLEVTYSNSMTDTQTMDVTVTANAEGTFPLFGFFVRPDANGQPYAYADASTLGNYTPNWTDSLSSLTTKYGVVPVDDNTMLKAGLQANGNRAQLYFNASQVAPKDEPHVAFNYGINLRNLTLTDISTPGLLGIASVQAIISNLNGAVSTVNVPVGGSVTYQLPADGVYKIIYRLTTNNHPVTGSPDIHDAFQAVAVKSTLGTVGTLLTSNVSQWDVTGQTWSGTFYTNGSAYTQRWQDGNGSNNGITTAVEADRSVGSYLGANLEERGGVFLTTNDTTADADVVKSVTGASQVMAIRCYNADPFYGQVFGETNPDFSVGTKRGQTSVNIRGVGTIEPALAPTETHLSIFAAYVFFNRDFKQTKDNKTFSLILGSNNSLEGFPVSGRESEHIPIPNIYQGTQDKRTVSPEGSPVESLDSSGTILLQADDVGFVQSADPNNMANDYVTGSIFGRRINAQWPIKTVYNRTGYLWIKAILKDGTTGRGSLRKWMIPIGDEGATPSLHLQPLFDYDDAKLWEPGAGPGQTQYAHIDTIGHYDARGGNNLWYAMQLYMQQYTNEATHLLYPNTFMHRQIGTGLSLPNNETILASVFSHFNISY